eukprot:TRINITY_DN12730_c0_g1_i1.p1 TRINITY_DN12730_c0_g1~~TRINITY_DN12730_c0_g1_i1.p1  ORF type:complete len:318 (+),score=77.82 TRINITY_DN12730_c0_g1_i1:48-1001(+)
MHFVGAMESTARLLETMQEAEGVSALNCLAMSLLAGLSTTLGAGLVCLLPEQRPSPEQMAFSLALAGGVMLSVTLLEFWLPLLGGGKNALPVIFNSVLGAACFFLLSLLVPEPDVIDGLGGGAAKDLERGSACRSEEEEQIIGKPVDGEKSSDPDVPSGVGSIRGRSARLAFVLMLSLTAHNFPEGFAVAVSAKVSERMGLVVMIAIAVHNIPEGIAIAVPVLVATGSRQRALIMSLLSGMAEPVGACCALLVLRLSGGSLSDSVMDNLLCVVGGVMCAVALKELLPEAFKQGSVVTVLSGTALGFALMALTSYLGA